MRRRYKFELSKCLPYVTALQILYKPVTGGSAVILVSPCVFRFVPSQRLDSAGMEGRDAGDERGGNREGRYAGEQR